MPHAIVNLFKEDFDWRTLVGENASPQQALRDVMNTLTAYGRHGISDNLGIMSQPQEYVAAQIAREQAIMHMAAQLAGEAGGFITPDMTPNFFRTTTEYRGTKNYEPDTSYLDFMMQRQMKTSLEDRREWEADIQFVLMKDAGEIRYGTFADTYASMRNYEWGAGFHIWTTWFEENVFGIKMSALAPKARYAYYDQIADEIYALLAAGITTPIAGASNILVHDLNTAYYEIVRTKNTFGKYPFANANVRLVCAPEWERYLNAAVAASYALGFTETLSKRMSITTSTKLSFTAGSAVIYMVVDGWEQNELGIRVPFQVYGQTKDIDTFSEKIAYRGAWGANIDPTSGRVLTFDTTAASFLIAPPTPVRLISP